LVSKRAIIDLRYPFFEDGTTTIIRRALGQDNINELLKLSEEYRKVDREIAAAEDPVHYGVNRIPVNQEDNIFTSGSNG
jgi:3-deoxy-D-arabino-heptulosonate 7-phosphate (DAHP) synthase class II